MHQLAKVLPVSRGGDSQHADDIPRYLRMMRGGRFDPRAMISHRLALQDINDGIARMRSGEVVHALVDFRPTP